VEPVGMGRGGGQFVIHTLRWFQIQDRIRVSIGSQSCRLRMF
jgi:hypothetical protein